MYVTETGGHRVAPMPTAKAKMVEYKMFTDAGERERERGGGGGTHLATTVKNTVRRLLRRTKSHRDAPSTNATVTAQPSNGNQPNNQATLRNKPNNGNDPNARRSQPPLPPTIEQHSSRNSYNYNRRHPRLRVRLQKPSNLAAVVDPHGRISPC